MHWFVTTYSATVCNQSFSIPARKLLNYIQECGTKIILPYNCYIDRLACLGLSLFSKGTVDGPGLWKLYVSNLKHTTITTIIYSSISNKKTRSQYTKIRLGEHCENLKQSNTICC